MPNSMNITPPVVGVTNGPEWAQEINNILTNVIAEHNHQPAQDGGVQLTQDAINITDDVSLNGNQLTNVNAVGLETLNAPASGSNRLYNDSGDLYYKDGNGAGVRITQNGGLAAASFGGISGLSGTNGSATFAGLSTFVWKKDATEYATMENGPIKIYSGNDPAPTNGIILQSKDGLASNTTLTLPNQLPAAQSFMVLSSSGEITASVPLANGIQPTMLAAVNYQTASCATTLFTSPFTSTSALLATINFTGSGRPVEVSIQSKRGNAASELTLFAEVVSATPPNTNTAIEPLVYFLSVYPNNDLLNAYFQEYRVFDPVPSGSLTPQSGVGQQPAFRFIYFPTGSELQNGTSFKLYGSKANNAVSVNLAGADFVVREL